MHARSITASATRGDRRGYTGSHPKPAPRIEARDFSVTLGPSRVVALKGMTLTVEAGEIVVLVGPSGCGKTTFLNSVCGLLPEGAELSGSLTVAKDVRLGYMPQKDALLPWRTVLGNVEVGPELRGMSRAERRAKAECADRTRRTYPNSATTIRTSCRAACASAFRWRACSPTGPMSF